MKVKTSSWHYKVAYLGDDFKDTSNNLCQYFWRIVLKVVLLSFFGFLCGFVICIYFTATYLISNTIFLLFILCSIGIPPYVIYKIRIKHGKPYELPGENILFQYLKAKKDKVCPVIEYE